MAAERIKKVRFWSLDEILSNETSLTLLNLENLFRFALHSKDFSSKISVSLT